jgi:hypothetical protein
MNWHAAGTDRKLKMTGYYALLSFKNNFTVTIAQGDSFLLNSFTCPSEFQAASRAAHGIPTWL